MFTGFIIPSFLMEILSTQPGIGEKKMSSHRCIVKKLIPLNLTSNSSILITLQPHNMKI